MATPFPPAPIKEEINNKSTSWLSWFKAVWTILSYLNFGFGNPTYAAKKGSIHIKLDATTTTDRIWINTNGVQAWAYLTTSA